MASTASIWDGTKNQLTTLLAISLTFLILCWISVALRVYARAIVLRTLGRDDASMVVSLLFYSATSLLGAVSVIEIRKDGVSTDTLHKMFIASTACYILAQMSLKISLGFFFLRIFLTEKWKRTLVRIAVCLTTVCGMGYFFVVICTCASVSLLNTHRYACDIRETSVVIGMSWRALDVLTDFIFISLAGFAIWSSQIPRPAKISASALLFIGTLGGLCSCVRLGLAALEGTFTYTLRQAIEFLYWSNLEAGLGITAASLATLRPLFRSCWERTRRSTSYADAQNEAMLDRIFGPSSDSSVASDSGARDVETGQKDQGMVVQVREWDDSLADRHPCSIVLQTHHLLE